MKDNIKFPTEKIAWFRAKLEIEEIEFEQIKKFKDLFINKKKEFSSYFFDYFIRIDETAFLLTHQKHGQHLSKIWEKWFESFFSENFSDQFLRTMWLSGLRHVEINIDHRFIMLSYSVLRRFCQEIVRKDLPSRDHEQILTIIDKMVDFCLLIETNAFVEATSRCDMEVVRGISHQVRNPLTVIGGNVMRLMRRSEIMADQDNIPEICNSIIEESLRLEHMVSDAAVYSDMFQKEAHHSVINLTSLISAATDRIHEQKKQELTVTRDILPEDMEIVGDREDLENMFFYIFRHCLDSEPREINEIHISAEFVEPSLSFAEIKVRCSAIHRSSEDIEKSFVPFYSSRPDGTGLGLSIARLAAGKSLGDILIDKISDDTVLFMIKLPVPVKDT